MITSSFHGPRSLLLFRKILGGDRQIAVALTAYASEGVTENIINVQIDKELKEEAISLRDMLFYKNIPGGTAPEPPVSDVCSVLYQMVLQHELYKYRWDLLRRYNGF